jgi:hypothetical protein
MSSSAIADEPTTSARGSLCSFRPATRPSRSGRRAVTTSLAAAIGARGREAFGRRDGPYAPRCPLILQRDGESLAP